MGSWFAIIMLSTDTRSAQVHVRLDKEGFARNLRSTNKGGDFPRPFLNAIFEEYDPMYSLFAG